jgi:hypothetical protein
MNSRHRITTNKFVDTFHTPGKRRPENRLAMIIAATLHDIVTGKGTDHHLGNEAYAMARRVRNSILRRRDLGRDITVIRLE